MDQRPVRLLVGHDGPFLGYHLGGGQSGRQGFGSGVLRGLGSLDSERPVEQARRHVRSVRAMFKEEFIGGGYEK